MSGLAIITEACIGVKDRACVDVCPVQCIYEFDPAKNLLFSEEEAGTGEQKIRRNARPRQDGVRDLAEPETLRRVRWRQVPETQGIGNRERLPYRKREPGHDLIGELRGARHGEHDHQQSGDQPGRLVEMLP